MLYNWPEACIIQTGTSFYQSLQKIYDLMTSLWRQVFFTDKFWAYWLPSHITVSSCHSQYAAKQTLTKSHRNWHHTNKKYLKHPKFSFCPEKLNCHGNIRGQWTAATLHHIHDITSNLERWWQKWVTQVTFYVPLRFASYQPIMEPITTSTFH